MKIAIILLATIFFCSESLTAQEKRDTIKSVVTKPAGTDKLTAKEKRAALIDSLDLTKDQAKKLKAINQDFRQQLKAVNDNTSLSTAERKQKNRALIQQQQSEVEKILSPAQFARYKEMIRKRKLDDD